MPDKAYCPTVFAIILIVLDNQRLNVNLLKTELDQYKANI